jgi:hypothetical protein
LSERTDNRARYVFEYGPTEANGTFQSVCWGDGTTITSGVTGLTVSAASANTDFDFIKTVGYAGGTTNASSQYSYVHTDGFVYHFYTEGNAVTNVRYFAKTNIDTGIRTNLFATTHGPSYRILVHGSYYIFYSTNYNGISFHVFNSSGNFLVRSGTVGSYTYAFTNTGSPTSFFISLVSNSTYNGSYTTNLLSDGTRLWAIPHTYYSFVYNSSLNPSIIKISEDTSAQLSNFDSFMQLTLDSFSGLTTSSTLRESAYLDDSSIWLLYNDLFSSQTERIIARNYTPTLSNIGSSQSLVFNSGTSSTSSSTDQFNFNTTWHSASNIWINNAFGAGLTNGDILTVSVGGNYVRYYITSTPSLSGSRYSVGISFISSNNAITFTNGSSYSLQESSWSTTINTTITRDRTIVYGESSANIYTGPISTSNPASTSYPYSTARTAISISPYVLKSNISGYDLIATTLENSYTSNGLTYYPIMLMGGKWFNPDVVSTRALLPSPFTKTSDKTMRITYDINFG